MEIIAKAGTARSCAFAAIRRAKAFDFAGAEEQLSLFEAPRDTGRQEALESSLDSIRERFGKSAVTPAVLLKNDLGIKT